MLLNAIDSGPASGDRVALLLHGMMGSAESWWRIAPLLVRNGYRMIALDLPGHGLSYRDEECSVESAAVAVVATVEALAGSQPIVAIGHSYGGTVLAAVTERMPVELAVYVDTPCAFTGVADAAALTAQYEADRLKRMDVSWLRASRPFYSETDATVEARAAARFDATTATAISAGEGFARPPGAGAILVRAQPSSFVSDEDAARFVARGADVREIAGAAHSVWYSHFDEFCATLPELFARGQERR